MYGAHSRISQSKDLTKFYRSVRSFTEALCEPLEIEDYVPQPCADVSPIKWNIAHTTWFFEEMILKRSVSGYTPFDPNFTFLFNSYYNSIGERTSRDHRGDLSRPTVREVFEYRNYVDEKMGQLLAGEVANDLRELVILGLNHEQQHQELFLTDLKFSFSLNPLHPVYDLKFVQVEESASSAAAIVSVPGGEHQIGATGEDFCFDNELSRHIVHLADFQIEASLVTNAEFLEFIDDGGYRDHRLWHADGWEWVAKDAVDSPLYWFRQDGEWFNYTLAGVRPVSLASPVCHVSYFEAAAFAEWKGMCLPTEFEWEAASDEFGWGSRWEWTNSAYLPYPGFRRSAGAVGEYNGKFMISQMVLRGASVATPPGHSRKTYRNFFYPHQRWQFTGIRLAR